MTARRRAATMGSAAVPAPDRAAGLAAFDLGERPVHAPAAPAPQPLAAPARTSPAASAEPAPAPGPRRSPRPRATAPTKLSPRIPASLFQQVNDARRRTGETHEAWFLRIAETVAEQIPALYPRRSGGATFPQRVARRRRAPSAEPLVQYPLRLTADEQAPLHAWLRELPVASMSELVSTIVRLGIAEAVTLDETR